MIQLYSSQTQHNNFFLKFTLYLLVIIIAHRLNTFKNCHGILLLKDGQSSAS